jgi:hypothetical protein
MCGRSEGERHGGGGRRSLGTGCWFKKLSGVRAVLKTAEMRPEEDRRGLTSWRSLAVGGAAWSEGNDTRGGVRSAPSGGWFGERTPSRWRHGGAWSGNSGSQQWRSVLGTEEHGKRQSRVDGESSVARRWWKRKGETHIRRAPFIAVQGGGRRVARRRNHERQSAAVAAVGTSLARSGADVWTVRLASGPHVVSLFSELFKLAQTWKLKISALHCSKNSQFLLAARLGYCEQFFQLCRHPIPNIIRAKNSGPDLTFETLMNFKRDLNLPEKSGKFSKILSWLDLHKSEFSWDFSYARMWVTIQVSNGVVWIK